MALSTQTAPTMRGIAFTALGTAFAACREASAAMIADDDDTAVARVDEAIAQLAAAKDMLR